MQKKLIGNAAIVILALIPLVLWITTNPTSRLHEEMNNNLQRVGEFFATTALVLFSCAIVLSTRAPFLEPFFGGLDKMYMTHKRTALTGFTSILFHFAIIPKDDFFTPGSYMGLVAMLGMLVLIVLTLAPRIPLPFLRWPLSLPYHQWKLTHKFVGVFFIAGLLHSFNVEHLTQESAPLDLYTRGMAGVAAVIYVYQAFISGFVRRKHAYTVEAVNRLNGTVAEVVLKPNAAKLNHHAGQFLFIHFPSENKLTEPHPFTISSAPKEDQVRLSIKTSGDFTGHLHEVLQPGTAARLEGPYGQMNYKQAGRKQIWVAGGIGVTPFLSWARDFESGSRHEIYFYYSVRTKEDALFWEELEDAGKRFPFFKPKLFCSNTDGRLTVEKMAAGAGLLADVDIFMCGPLPMTMGLAQQFRAAGVPDGRLHFEEFNFR